MRAVVPLFAALCINSLTLRLAIQKKNLVPLATWWLHDHTMKKACYFFSSRLSFIYLGWLMGLEPTTTGITILDSTN